MLGLNEMSDSMGEEGLIKFLLDNNSFLVLFSVETTGACSTKNFN